MLSINLFIGLSELVYVKKVNLILSPLNFKKVWPKTETTATVM